MGKVNENQSIGIVGGGQLALMMLPAARNLGYRIVVLDPDQHCASAGEADELIIGDFSSSDALKELGARSDYVTFEIERVSVENLKMLECQGKIVRPSSSVLSKIQDKLVQKEELEKLGVPVGEFRDLKSREDLAERIPCVWKARTSGYDGKGVIVLRSIEDMDAVPSRPGYTETLVDLDYELAILVARGAGGAVVVYPVSEIIMDSTRNILDTVFAPASAPLEMQKRCQEIAVKIAESFDYVGIMAIEFFVCKSGLLRVNEVSPRPHNSGHYTIEASATSQFEQHMRAVTGQKLGSSDLKSSAATLNLLGSDCSSGEPVFKGVEKYSINERIYIHNYRKPIVRPGRKMGHVTILGDDREYILEKAKEIKSEIKVEGTNG